ncbi:albino3-like protein chloroplastic-like [Trifolium pratense]|uniref:Albino3-like protein chloroplastic-like n=1 Tax=Trifolium pratense TaxID=57577 RepID=A0A2K3NN64_TRIPR|nr:albino3-like protein chloroplastic-like [Trifolium pratense]
MAVLLPSTPTILSTPFGNRTTTHFPLRPHSHTFLPSTKRFLRGSLSVSRFGFQPGFLTQPDDTEFVIRELFNRAEGFLYTIADAAVLSSDTVVNTAIATAKQDHDWLSLITNYVETVLKVLKFGLSTLHVPYAYGFAIIMLAVLVNAVVFPLRIKQVEYAEVMRSLQPKEEAILKQYAGDEDTIVLETVRLYESSSIDPVLATRLPPPASFCGDPLLSTQISLWTVCWTSLSLYVLFSVPSSGEFFRLLPSLLTIPVWIGLYRAFSNMADGGPISEGFFWIPSLSGPTTIGAWQNGSGISWLFPFVDGHPPLGWPDTLAYLVLPVLHVVSEYISRQIIQSSQGFCVAIGTSSEEAHIQILPREGSTVPSEVALFHRMPSKKVSNSVNIESCVAQMDGKFASLEERFSQMEGPSVYTKTLEKEAEWSFGVSLTFERKIWSCAYDRKARNFLSETLLTVQVSVLYRIRAIAMDTDPNVKSSQEIFHVNIQDTDFDFDMESFQVKDEVILLVFGCFTLLVPSGLGLYWFTYNILSTLQRIWLQKLEGAKNPLRHVLDDNVKNDQMQIQKSVSKLNSTKVEKTRTVDKYTAEWPRPGDRLVLTITTTGLDPDDVTLD